MKMRIFIPLLLASFALASAAQSPYSGQEQRDIKSLSKAEIDGYLAGSGMGYAKAAELNHYPGPKHVLELATDLDLSEKQIAKTEQIFQAMQQRATELGRQMVDKEDKLDKLFAIGTITSPQLKDRLAEIGALQAEIRFVHLDAHLALRTVLSENQALQYDQLRGYADGHTTHKH